MGFKDYYATLGVAADADDKVIKQTYRKLARQYHPDLNPDDQDAEVRFKEINEAFQVLGDPEKRKKYNDLRQQYQYWQERGGSDRFDWGDWQQAPEDKYTYTWSTSPEDMQDLFGQDSPFTDFFGSIFGQRFDAESASGPRRGRNIDIAVKVSLDEAFWGTKRTVQLGDRYIEAQIPPGVYTGSRVRLAGLGQPGINEGPAGDIYLTIEVLQHPRFERSSDDLICVLPVDIYTAVGGGKVPVQTIDRTAFLTIPPRTQADRTFRLRGLGMPRLNRPTERGDLYVRVKLVLPEQVSDEEIEALRNLGQRRRSNGSNVNSDKRSAKREQ
ncbi:MAG: J domain-containing protein [Chloroflexales bacterium]|nr:J domain-containing protein [Chloroflexales bacterium]